MVDLSSVATLFVVVGTLLQLWVTHLAGDRDERAEARMEDNREPLESDYSYEDALEEISEFDNKVYLLISVTLVIAVILLIISIFGV